MTDEERAREIVQRYGRTLQPERQMELGLAIWDAIQVSRAEEREKCAKRLDDMACERLKDVHALTDVIHKHAARGSGKKAGKVAAYKKSMARRHLAYRDAAAAIRAMGDKG